MRPLPQRGLKNNLANTLPLRALKLVALAALAMNGCANIAPLPSPPTDHPPGQDISVTVTPSSASVLLGNEITFTATVKNHSDTTVSWSVNGTPGGAAATGTISSAGIYTAPLDLPVPVDVLVTATSHANSKKSGSAAVTIQSDVVVTLPSAPPGGVTVELGAVRAFAAALSSSAHPDQAVVYSLSGVSCPLGCGSVDEIGNFTAPRILPNSATVTLTARSVADPSKQASAAITVTSNFVLNLSAPASVAPGATVSFVATLTPVPGSNPETALTWSLSGTGCTGAACGTLAVVTIQSAGGNATATTASYTAPVAAPSPDSVTVSVIPIADPSKVAQRQFLVQGSSGGNGVTVALSPAVATRAINHRITSPRRLLGPSTPS